MGRFNSEFNKDFNERFLSESKARRDAAARLAAAVEFGLERLEGRALFTVGPIANPGGPYTVNEGSTTVFNASSSTDDAGTITSYKWDLNYTGAFVANITTSNPDLNYTAGAAKAQRTLALEVVDSNGTTSPVVTTTLSTVDVLPNIIVTGGATQNRGATSTINWTYTDPGNEAVTSWVVDWGDGSGTQTLATSARTSNHVYADDGNFTVTVTSNQTVLGNAVTSSGTTGFTITPVLPVVTLTGNAHVNEVTPYTLGFSAVDPSAIDNYVIDWGDGSTQDVLPGTSSSDTHIYETHGTYNVTVTAIDDAGDSGEQTKQIISDDVPPAPVISGEPGSNPTEGDTISLSAAPHDPGSSTTSYAWSVTKNGQAFTLPNGTAVNASTLSFVAGYAGSYVATCVVTDDASETGTANSTAITVNAAPPSVTIGSGYSTSINKGDSLSLTATATDPGTADTYSYLWSATLNGNAYTLPSGTNTASTLNFVAGRSGNFILSVLVTDRDLGTDSASTTTITAAAVNPTVVITNLPPSPINEGTSLTYTATPTDTGTNETFTYLWTVTKGGVSFTPPSPINMTQSTLTFIPEDEGAYVATCVVTDADASSGTGVSNSVTVNDVPPTVAITGAPTSSINEGTAVNLTATPTEASTDRTYSYLWSVTRTYNGSTTAVTLANGTNTSAALSFTPATEGTYIATCVVTDDEGGQTTQATSSIVVATVPATVAIAGDTPTEINEGTAVNLSAAPTEAGSGHTFTYSWSVTKNGVAYTLPGSGSTDVATGGTASASSSLNGYSASNAFDGNDNTSWVSFPGAYPQYLEYDLGAGNATAVTGYGLTAVPVNGTNPAGWTFQGSNDQNSWTNLDTRAGDPGLSYPASTVFNFANTTAFRYYRIGFTGDTGAGVVGISEMTLLASNGPSTTSPTLGFTPTTKGNYVATVTVMDEDGHIVSQNSNTITVDNVPPTVTVSGEPGSSIPEGTAVSLSSTETEPGPGGFTYQWSLENGTTPVSLTGNASATTNALNFTPLVAGTYVASLQVTDSEGGVTTQPSQNIVVTVAPPTASMTGIPSTSVNEYSPITLGVTSSDVNPANTDTFAWTVTKDGNAYTLPTGTDTTDDSFTFTPNDAATWAVACVVTNTEGGHTTVGSGNISVLAIAPTVSIAVSDGQRAEGTPIAASATLSNVGTTDTVTYLWSVQKDGVNYQLSSGVSTTGSSFLFTPGDEGSYQIFLTATDSGGPTSTSASAISVADNAPGVTITGATSTSPEGTAINLGTTVTQTGTNDSVSTYAWSVTKDGQPFSLGNTVVSNSTLSFTPVNEGSYVATVVVTNAGDGNITGGQTQMSTSAMSVTNVPPSVTVTGTSGPVADGGLLSFSAAATEPGNNTLTYAWTVKRNGHLIELPSGTTTNASSLSFAAGRAGSFVAYCLVTDSEEGSHTGASASVAVTDVPPTVTISGTPSSSIAAGTDVPLTTVVTDAGAAEHFTYAWSVTRNGSNYPLLSSVATTGSTFDFTPDRVGSYVVSVVVTDSDGGQTTQTSSFGVTDVAPTVTVTGPLAAVNEGQSISFSSTATNPTIDDTFTNSWTVTRNNAAFTLPVGTNATGTTLSFIAPEGGTYVATNLVTDSAGSTGSNSGSATVNWLTPTVTIGGAPSSSIAAGSTVALTSAPVEAGSSHTYSYAWSVTRNGIAYTLPQSVSTTGSTFTFNPGRAGSFVASLLLTDEDTQTATASTTAIAVTDVPPAVGISGAPLATIPEGTAISLTSTPTSPGADETFTYLWSVTKGGVAYTLPSNVVTNTASLNFTPGVAGSYVANCLVTDLDNGVHTGSTQAMVVSATAASVSVSGAPSAAVNAGTVINLSATATNSGPGEQFGYVWSVTLNGQTYALPQGTATTSQSFSFTTTDAGLYVATCVATDTSGQAGSGNSGNINVNAVQPTVTITGTPLTAVNEGTPVTLTAVPADANSADTYTYAWSVTRNTVTYVLPQSTVTNTAGFTFTPTDPGTYVATVTIVDKANLTASTTSTFPVSDVAPTVTINGTPGAPVNVGTALPFTSTTSSIGTTDTISTYAWSVTKNGQPYTPLGNPSTTGSTFGFTPDGQGTYVVTLAATDNYGQTGTSSTTSIIARPVAPTVNVTGTSGQINEGDPVSLGTTVTDPSTGDTYSYAWTVTRNSVAYTLPITVATNLSTLNFNADRTGTYVATVTVTDMDQKQTIATSSSIVSADVPPTVAITGVPSSSIPENSTPVVLTATPTEPGSGQTYTYAWTVTMNGSAYTLPIGTTVNAATLTFTPGRTGSYVATCNVVDGDGGTGFNSSSTIAVTAVNPTVTITGTPTTAINEGSIVSLTAAATDPGVGDTFTYAWTITRNGLAYTPSSNVALTNAALHFRPGLPGSYVATCTVTDADQAVGTASTTAMTVNTVNPTVSLTGAPTSAIGEGTAINLATTVTSPRTADTYTYAWTVTQNGNAFTLPIGVSTTSSTLAFTPTVEGSYVATVVVTDLDSATTTRSTSAITVNNTPPTVSIVGLPTSDINTGDSYSLSTTPTEPGAGNYTYLWTVSENGSTVLTSSTSTLSGVAGLSGAYNVSLSVTDGEGGVGTASGTINVDDVAPTVTMTGAPSSSPEGTAISLGSMATDVGTTYGETLAYAWTVTQGGNAYTVTNATSPTFSFTPNEFGSYVATLTVTDSQGTVSTASNTINVTDVAPTATLAAVPAALRKSAVTFSGAYTDPGTGDTQTINWNYGDGTSQSFAGTAANALTPSHTYASAGQYTATMTVTDNAGESSTSSQSVTVNAAMVGNDPFASGKTALFVNGTGSSSAIKFYSEAGGRVKVTIDGISQGTFAPTGHIIANSEGGTDAITVASTITNPSVLYAGSGNDTLLGGGGDNVLVAGSGNDILTAGSGPDILIGGVGRDTLTAGTGNNLLIGGSTLFSTNQTALALVAAQWQRTDESFANVLHQLHGTLAGSLASPYLVSGSSILDTLDNDILVAGSGRDWLVAGNGDQVQNYSAAKDIESTPTSSKAKIPVSTAKAPKK